MATLDYLYQTVGTRGCVVEFHSLTFTLFFLLQPPLLLALAWLIGRGGNSPTPTVPLSDDASASLLSARRRMLIAAITALLVVVLLLVLFPYTRPAWAILVPGIGVIVGLLVYTWWPAHGGKIGNRRAASLESRNPTDSLAKTTLVWWGVAAVLLVGAVGVSLLLRTRATGLGFESGFKCELVDGVTQCRLQPPLLGVVLGLPLLALTAVLGLVTWIAVRRVSSLPVVPGADYETVDRRWRSQSVTIIVQLSAGAVFIEFSAFSALVFLITSSPSVSDSLIALAPNLSVFAFTGPVLTISLIIFGSAVRRASDLPRYSTEATGMESDR